MQSFFEMPANSRYSMNFALGLSSTAAEMHVYETRLEIQNENLLDSRAQIEESQKKYLRHFDLAPVSLIQLNRQGLILESKGIHLAIKLDAQQHFLSADAAAPPPRNLSVTNCLSFLTCY